MAGEDGAVVLPISIDFGTLDVSPLENQIASAISAGINRGMADAPKGAGGRAMPAQDVASPATGRGGAPATTGKGAKSSKTDIAVNAADVSREIQIAIDGHKFKLNIDQSFLINQIQSALNHAFQITVSGIHQQGGGAIASAATTTVHDSVGAMSRETLDVPKELREALHQVKDKNKSSVLAGAIDDLYGTLVDTFAGIGKTVPKATDHISKAMAIFDSMGDAMFDAAKAYDPQKAAQTMKIMDEKFGVKGGAALNLATTLSAAVKAGGRTGFWGGATDPNDRHTWSIRQLRQAGSVQAAPAPTPIPMPTPAAIPVAPAATSAAIVQETEALRIGLARPSEVPVRSMKIGDTAELMRFFGRQSPGNASSRTRRGQAQIDRRTGGMEPSQGPGLPRIIPGEDPMAEIAAMEQIGERPENVRRLINWGALQGQAGGVPIDLRGLAISAMKPLGMEGSIRGVFKGRSSGDFYSVQPDLTNYDESKKKIEDAGRRRQARLPGIDEAVAGVKPTAAAEEIVRAQYGEEGVAFFNQPAVKAEFRKAVAHASRLSPIGVGQKGFAHLAAGSPGSILAGLRDEEESIAAGSGIDPETRAINSAVSREENRVRIAGGAGLSPKEMAERRLRDLIPKAAGIRIAAGGLPDFPKLLGNILEEVDRGTEPERLSAGSQAALAERGGGAKGYAAARGQELINLLLNGAQDVPDEDIGRVIGAKPGTITPEQAAQYRPGLGPDDAKELRGLMSGILSDVVGGINPSGYARIVADKNNSAGLGTTKSTPFADEAVNRKDAYTGRSYTAPKRKKTANERELAQIIANEKKTESTLVDGDLGDTTGLSLTDRKEMAARLKAERERAMTPEELAEKYNKVAPRNPRKVELQALLEGAAQLGAPAEKRVTSNMLWAPTPEMEAEFAAQQKLQAEASSHARSSGKNATGDDLRRAAAKAGQRVAGPLPPDALNPYFDPKALDKLLRDADAGTAAAGGGGARPPRGRIIGAAGTPPGGGGSGGGGAGFGEVSGAVHVIIDGQPIAVTWEGASPGAATGGRSSTDMGAATHGAEWDRTFGLATLNRQSNKQGQQAFGKEVERMRGAGISDAAIKKAAKNAGLGVAAEAFFNEDVAGGGFGAGGGTGGGRAALNLRRRKLGLAPIKFRTEETLGAIDDSDTSRSQLGAEVRKAQRFEPRRGFTASVTDIFTNMFPFIEKQSAAIQRFAREGQQQSALEARTPVLLENKVAIEGHIADVEASRAEAKAKLDAAQASKKSTQSAKADLMAWDKELKNSQLSLGGATDALEAHNTELDFQKQRTTSAREGLPGAGGKVAAFGAGAIAAGGAIAVGMAISNIVNTLIQDTMAAVSPAVDRAAGSPMATAAITNAIAKTGASGTFSAATAQLAAQAGMAPGPGQDALTQRARGIAGNTNLAAQADIIRAQYNLAQQGRGFPNGIDASIATSTGGIFGSSIGVPGIGDFKQSTQELLKLGLTGLPSLSSQMSPNVDAARAAQAAGQSYFTERWTGALGESESRQANVSQFLEKFTTGLGQGSAELDNFNSQAEKSGSSLKLVQATDEKAVANFAKSLRDAGLPDFAAAVEKSKLLFQGGPSTGESGRQYLGALQGAAGYDVKGLLAASQDQRRAREGLRVQQLGFALGNPEVGGASGGKSIGGRWDGGLGLHSGSGAFGGTIQQQFGMNYAANPLPTGQQIIDLGKATGGTSGQGGIDLSGTAKGYNDIAVAAADAVKETKAFVAQELPDFSKAFSSSIDEVASIGRQISNIKIGQETKQAAYAADQYSFSIYQASRSLKDAKYLTGQITIANKDSVGYLQKQEYLLNRKSQSLSLQMSQRQINFQTALAGFQAPGITGQERAARMEEAKQEAAYAQKQLDIQKELYGLSGDEFMAQAKIQVKDLQKQIGLMIRGRSLTLSTVQAEKEIDVLNTKLGVVKGRAETIYQSAVAKRNAMYGDAAELVAATGEDLAAIANDVIDAYRKVYIALKNGGAGVVYRPLTAAEKYQERRTGENIPGSDPRLGYASGIVGSTRGRTDITVGEADGELVAVVKGPKTTAVMGNMSGSGSLSIGPFIFEGGGDREKMESLAREVTDLVEARLGMKAKLVGLRSATA